LAVSAIGVSSAQAASVPFNANLNYGYANIGPGITGTQLLDGTQNATFAGTLDDTTGAITAGDLTIPNKVFDGAALGLGAGSTITLNFNEAAPITGTAGPAAGQLALASTTYNATATIAGAAAPAFNGQCVVTVPIAFSTETTTPYHGRRFNNPDTTGPGSVSGSGTMTNTGAPNAATCGALTAGGIATGQTAAIWIGHNSIPTNGVPWVQTLDHGSIDVGALTDLPAIIPSAPAYYIGLISGTAVANATDPTPSTATMAVPGGTPANATAPGFHFTQASFTTPFGDVQLDLSLDNPGAAGTFNTATGAMTLGGNYQSVVNEACVSDPDPFNLSTGTNVGAHNGQSFAGLGGNGAMGTTWANLPAAPDPDPMTAENECAQLNAVGLGLPGGLWVSHGIDPAAGGGGGGGSTTTPPPPTTAPKKKKCKKKKGKKSAQVAKKKCKKKKK